MFEKWSLSLQELSESEQLCQEMANVLKAQMDTVV